MFTLTQTKTEPIESATDYVLLILNKAFLVFQLYNLGEPSLSKNTDIGCNSANSMAITFGIDRSFLLAILICLAVLTSKYEIIPNYMDSEFLFSKLKIFLV